FGKAVRRPRRRGRLGHRGGVGEHESSGRDRGQSMEHGALQGLFGRARGSYQPARSAVNDTASARREGKPFSAPTPRVLFSKRKRPARRPRSGGAGGLRFVGPCPIRGLASPAMALVWFLLLALAFASALAGGEMGGLTEGALQCAE